jgi:PAS domain S-box-containing protein
MQWSIENKTSAGFGVALLVAASGVLIRRDIAGRKRAEAALRKRTTELEEAMHFLNAVVEHLPSAVFIKSAEDLRFVGWNNAMEALIGLRQQEVLGKTDYDLFPKNEADFFVTKDREVLAGNTVVDIPEEAVQTAHHGVRLLATRKVPIFGADGKPKYLLGISSDITEHQQAKLALQQAHDELEQRVRERTAELAETNEALHTEIVERMQAEAALEGERALLARRVEERTADLSAANAELARAARLKDEFLASMSHELRTPLNTILGMAETMQEGVLGSINDEQTDALGHIEESGRHLLALINDILDLSKVEAGKLDLNVEEIVLADVWQASVRLVTQTATQKRLHVTCSIDSTVTVLQADARRLKQILVNLLSNAVKFTPEGGAIGLEVVGDPAAQLVRLTVWDTGIGIAADDLPRLFQPFVQLDSRLARHYTGTGLGLALVDRMAALHGGSVAVESILGHGTRFTITLPWTAAPSAADSVAPVDRAELPAADRALIERALVIEDSPTAATQLARYLRELGADARVHPYGVGTLEVALDVCPDVILLDIQLPDRSGWDVLAQLKVDPRVRAIPVVVVSVVDDRARGLALGAAAYLVKPISRQQLQDALDTIPAGGAFHTLHSALIVAPGPPATPAPVILLAEDEENNIYTLSTYLEAKGYQVIVARNGAEALSRVHDARPDLILMDIQMPGMDGLEAIRRIRADTALGQAPIIALTALAMSGDRERCLAAGANDYLSKPVSLKELVAAIEAHLQHPAASTEASDDTY